MHKVSLLMMVLKLQVLRPEEDVRVFPCRVEFRTSRKPSIVNLQKAMRRSEEHTSELQSPC